ncbi:hybrid sensor histidine kinase/response regulator [Indioceanicola profundi]|uniref:hybrid sensor histidine kinase/response regulator n=1 Tax=Indioceanicola profundi TaxID=2220096 RepID=UPI000E6AABFA|nr:ATP-binding protein [Indioceanicola profundi]
MNLLTKASHDLRQPFQAMRLFLHLLESKLTDPGQHELAQRLEQALDSGEGMLNNLIEMNALEVGKLKPNPVEVELGSLMARLGQEFAAEAEAKGLTLRVVRSTARARTDAMMLERMLRQLLVNAVRHTEQGRVLLGVRRRGAELEIQVLDTGPGIPEDKREEVFAPFVRLPGSEKRQGLGLGLAIVRRSAEMLGHGVELRSPSGKGACFAVRLPPADGAAAEKAETVQAAPATVAEPALPLLIAVAEDDRLQLAALDGMLREWNLEPVAAPTREALMAALAKAGRPPALVVTDYRLPGGASGPDVIRDVRAAYGAGIPGLLLTGDNHPDTLAEAEAAGLVLVQKPIHPVRLRRAVDAALGRTKR